MNAQDTHQDTPDLDGRTRMLAYELWEQAGKLDGQDLEFWERAKEILSSEAEPDELSPAPPDVQTD